MSATRYLLDTNVVSELRQPRPYPGVENFVAATPLASLYISVLTVGELQKGLAKLQGKRDSRAASLALWINSLLITYAQRILPVDLAAATVWGEISTDRTRPIVDTLLAATAITHNLTLVTRNTKDFADTGVKLLNPWLP